VAAYRKQVNESKHALIARDSRGRSHEETEPAERVCYAELMQDLLYLPKRQSTLQQFFVKAHKKLEQHEVSLRLPQAIELDCYNIYTQRFEKIMKQGLELPKDAFYALKPVMRELATAAKETAVKTMRQQAARVLRRVLSLQISEKFPACF
jgi:hypothetical protein